jgi:hypothetical protein
MIRFDKITELYKSAAIHGKLAMVYHGSNTPPEEFIELWKKGSFRPGSGSGQAVGPGLYTVYNKGGSNTESGEYGSYVYKFVVNLNNYLILVEEEISKVYPELDGLSYKEKLLRQCEKFDISKEIVLDHISEQRIPSSGPGAITSVLARKINDGGLHYGIVYRGKLDGDCCLIQIPEKAKLVGYEVGGKEVKFDKEKIKEINKNYKKLSSNSRNPKERLLEYVEKYPEKAISIIESKWDSILHKNDSSNTAFYWKAERRAAENLIESNQSLFFETGLYEAHPDLGRPAAESLVEKNPNEFFRLKLHETYLELGRPAAESWAEKGPEGFFIRKLHETYPELARPAAKSWAEKDPEGFFIRKLHETYPELGRPAAESWAEKDPGKFLNFKLHETYPELGRPAAESVAEKDPNEFFRLKLDKTYPDLKRPAAESLAEKYPKNFFKLKLHETYPELEIIFAKSLIRKFPEQFFRHLEVIKASRSFPSPDDAKKYLDAYREKRIFKRNDGYKITLWLAENYENLEDFGVKYLAKKDFKQFFKNDYPNKSKEYAELGREKAAWYFLEDPKSYFDKNYDKLYPEQNKKIKKILFERSYWNIDYGDLIHFSLKLNLDLSNEEILKLIKDMFKDLGDHNGNPKRYYNSISEAGAGGKSQKALKALEEYPGPLADRFKSELSRQWDLLPEVDDPYPDDLPPDLYADDNAIESKISRLIHWLNKSGFKKEAVDTLSLYKEATLKLKMSPLEIAVALGLLSEKALIGDDEEETKSKKKEKKEKDVIEDLLKELREFDLEKEAAKKRKKSKKKKDRTPTKPELWSASKAWAKRKYDVWPSAYAVGAALKRYKEKGGGWRGPKPKK